MKKYKVYIRQSLEREALFPCGSRKTQNNNGI